MSGAGLATVANKVNYNYKQKQGELLDECCGFGLWLWVCIYIFFLDVMDPEAEFYKKGTFKAEKPAFRVDKTADFSAERPTFLVDKTADYSAGKVPFQHPDFLLEFDPCTVAHIIFSYGILDLEIETRVGWLATAPSNFIPSTVIFIRNCSFRIIPFNYSQVQGEG